jgi:hypothetical protein
MKRPMLESPAFPLFALPFVALGAIPSALDGNIGRWLPATAWGHLPTSWRKMKSSRLAASGVLGGNVAQLLVGVLKNVTVFALAQVPRVAFRSGTCVPLASLLASLGLRALTLSPQWGLG